MAIPSKQHYSKRTIRLPKSLIEQVEQEGDKHGRSFNAEVIAKLIEAYAMPSLADLARGHDDTQKLVRQVLAELGMLNLRR